MNSKNQLIKELDLKPHPEGGYFKETYRSVGEISEPNLGENYKGKRNCSTCIYFLLTSEAFSTFHRIQQDEIWHFYDGSPIRLHMISPEGQHSEVLIGRDFSKSQTPQFVVPGGYWFAAEVIYKNDYALVGCTVFPGFDFKDFELKNRAELLALFPHLEGIITRLTHH